MIPSKRTGEHFHHRENVAVFLFTLVNMSLQAQQYLTPPHLGQVIAIIDFMYKYTCVCTSYEGQLNDEWIVKNGVQQRGISSGILFNFYPNEVVSDNSKIPAGCTLNCSKIKTLG